jgi:hypothetical protein
VTDASGLTTDQSIDISPEAVHEAAVHLESLHRALPQRDAERYAAMLRALSTSATAVEKQRDEAFRLLRLAMPTEGPAEAYDGWDKWHNDCDALLDMSVVDSQGVRHDY